MKIPAAHNQISQQPFNAQKTTDLTDGSAKQDGAPSFVQRLEDGLKQVADTQQNAATLAQNYELGLENDLAKVMVGRRYICQHKMAYVDICLNCGMVAIIQKAGHLL